MSEQDLEQLRALLTEEAGDDIFSQAARGSLIAFASRTPEMRAVVEQALSPVRAELDLHLGGAGVSDHETRAFVLGRFMNRTANAVKEIAKSVGGLARLPADLQVVAPAPGSVRVVFRAPEHRPTQQAMREATVTESLESAAMRRLVALLLQAEREEIEGSPLEAALHELNGSARNAVRLLGDAVIEGHWRLDGEFRRRGQETAAVALSEGGAQRLVAAAKTTEGDVRQDSFVGIVDGWVWSEEVMSFEPTEGRRFRAAVPEGLQARVAELVHEPRPTVRATFTVVTVHPPGDARSARRSYALDQIVVVDQQPLPERDE